MNIKFDYIRLIIIFITVSILFQALPVHFFADKAEYLFLGKYFSNHPLQIISPFHPAEIEGITHLFHYRPVERLFWVISYIISGTSPLAANALDSLLFILLAVSLYNITLLLSKSRISALVAVLFFLSMPANYKLLHWLGTPTLISSSFTALSSFFLFSSIISNSYRRLFAGLAVYLFAVLTTMTAVLIVPVILSLFYLLYRPEYSKNKRIFLSSMAYILIAGAVVFILERIAWQGVSKEDYAIFILHGVNVKRIIPNAIAYYRIFLENSYPVFFILALSLFLLKPNRVSFLALVWFIIQLVVYLPLSFPSSRYFSQSTLGLSMFFGTVLIGTAKEIFKTRYLVMSLLFLICVFFSTDRMRDNAINIRHSFELAKISYENQKLNMKRLSSLPPNALIYVDDEAVSVFYEWILRAMDKSDVRIAIDASKRDIEPALFFEGETAFVRTEECRYIIDKLGDWRF